MAEVEIPVFTALTEAKPVEKPVETPVETPKLEEKLVETRTYTQEDLDRITAKVKKNERYRTRKEVEAFYQGRESVVPKTEPQVTEEKAPTREGYESYEAFLEAKADFAGRRGAREERTRLEKETTEKAAFEARSKATTTFQEKAREKFPDMDEKVAEIGNMPMYMGVQDAIAESEFGPDILNELVSKPAELERLMKMSQTAAIREIGKLEARFEAATPKTTPVEVKQPSKAPTPIKPVIGKAEVGDGEPSHDKPDEWRRWRERQIQQRKAGAK